MHVVRFRLRAELRSTWRGLLVVAVVLGLLGGIGMASVAGARRGASALPRMVQASNAHDVLVNPDFGTFSSLDPFEVKALSGVRHGGVIRGGFIAPEADGELVVDIEPIFSDGVIGYEVLKPIVRSGRMPDPDVAEEILLTPATAARLGVRVGEIAPFRTITMARIQALMEQDDKMPPIEEFELLQLRVVGVGDFPDHVASDAEGAAARILYTPALLAQHGDTVAFWGAALRLADPSDQAAFEARVQELAPDEPVAFHWMAPAVDRFQRSIRPQLLALAGFGLVVAAAALLAAVTTLARHAASLSSDRTLASTMGLGSRAQALVGAGHGVLVGAVGAVVALAAAVVVSGRMPIGPAGQVEPAPGTSLDPLVLVPGVLMALLVLAGAGASVARRSTRPRVVSVAVARPSRLAAALAGLGAAPGVVLGARMAFDGQGQNRSVSARMTVGTVAVAVVAVAGAVVFGASLEHVVATPRLHGSNWDALVSFSYDPAEVDGGDDLNDPDAQAVLRAQERAAADELAVRAGVDGVSVGAFAQLDLAGAVVPTLGLDVVSGSAHPTIVDGREPVSIDEVVLGRRTMAALDVRIGDRVEAPTGTTLEVVGRAVFPGYSVYSGQDSTEMGTGAWMTTAGLRAVSSAFDVGVFVDIARDRSPEEVLAGFDPAGLATVSDDGGIDISSNRPVEVATLQRIRSTPAALAVSLGSIGALVAAHALLSAVRARRGDLAVFRVLGMTRFGAAGVVVGHASLVALAALLVGVPLGIATGRRAWTAVIENLGGVSVPVNPVWSLVLVAVVVLAGSNVVAAVPARRARHLRPAEILRAE